MQFWTHAFSFMKDDASLEEASAYEASAHEEVGYLAYFFKRHGNVS
jgi:hypothetical protein